MKQLKIKNKLSKSSQDFLKKYQSGGQEPLSPLPMLSQAMPQLQSISQPQVPNISNYAISPQAISNMQSFNGSRTADLANPNEELSQGEQLTSIATGLPLVGNMVKSGYGAYQVIKSFSEKKKAKQKEKYFEQDLKERQRDVRLNSYLNTPYGSYQKGGVMDSFSANYNQMQMMNQQSQQQWEDYYSDLNKQNEQKWKNLRNSGFKNQVESISGQFNDAMKIAGMVLQDGGEINQQNQQVSQQLPDTQDIYSENFNAQEFLGTETEKQVTTENENKELMDWVMQDEETYSPIQEEYEMGNQSSSVDGETSNIIAKIGYSESRNNYNEVNDISGTTGKYQFHPRYWADQIKEFSGLPDDYSKDEVMDYFKNNPNIQEQFMNHVVEDIYKPEIQKLKPYIDRYGFNEEQMIRMLHYRGLSDTRKRLISGDFSLKPEEKIKYKNPEILDYINR